MGDYDNIIDRTAVGSYLLPDEFSKEILQALPTSSFTLRMMRKLPNLSSKVYKMPVLHAFATAYFIAEGSRKKTTDLAWTGVDLTAEELAVIVPVPENVLEDMASQNYDLWGEVRPRLLEALGVAIDAAVLHGTSKPASWPVGLVDAAVTAGNTISMDDVGEGLTFPDMASALLGQDGLWAGCEKDGYIPNGALGALDMMGRLRDIRDANGQFLFMMDMTAANTYRIAGVPLTFPDNGAFDPASALLLIGNFQKAVYAMRRDISFKVATEATIHNAEGDVIYNLFQDDMVALRVTMRLGWALPNPKNLVNQTDETRFPFAVLTPES
jgi:predicted phage gp36 major capsid-like protein